MIVSSSTYGMGDILVLTSVAKHIPHCEVRLQPEARRFSRFFRNISNKIIITENIMPTPDIGPGHYAQKKLRAFGIENQCYLPYVHLTEEEKKEGLNWARQYDNPIIFVPNVSLQWKKEREPDSIYFQNLVSKLAESATILQFGLSNNFTEYKHTIPILDVSIDSLIKYYYGVSRFIGVDTGDTHLMLAVGGSCKIYIPRFGNRLCELWNYNSDRAEYYYYN